MLLLAWIVLAWIEDFPLSIWVRESTWGFPISLTMHAIGMGVLAGINFVFALRVLGIAPQVPLLALKRFFPLLWASAVLSLFSGLLLLLAYPAKGLTNPLFYLKLCLICSGLIIINKLAAAVTSTTSSNTAVITGSHKILAVCLLLLWMATITAGRFLAYTHSVLTVSELMVF